MQPLTYDDFASLDLDLEKIKQLAEAGEIAQALDIVDKAIDEGRIPGIAGGFLFGLLTGNTIYIESTE